MRGIITFIVGLYVTVALVVAGAGVWHFTMDKPQATACTPAPLETGATDDGLAGGPNWMGYVAYRAAAWPKAYWDEKDKADDIVDWLMIGFDPFGGKC